MNRKMNILLLFFSLGVISSEKVRFDNFKVYRLIPTNLEQLKTLAELKNEYDFWTDLGRLSRPVDILVPPSRQLEFEKLVKSYEISYKYMIENVQSLIDEEEVRLRSRCKDMDWKDYPKLDEIYDWMDEVTKKYKFVKKIIIGKSYQGRRINGLEITFNENNTGVFIESGSHGREWIAPAATSWMVNQILESPAKSVFRNFTYFYIPLFNPDGYYYSWNYDRLWKKTRTPYKFGLLTCHGADLNKNWDFQWNKYGASSNPCSENFAGPSAFSEKEAKSISSYLKCIAVSRNVDIYLSYHSYSQLLLYPWDHEAKPAPQRDLWQRIGELAAADLKTINGTEFEVGNTCEFQYPSSGISREWYHSLYNSTINYVYQLRDTGTNGYFLPPEQIIPSGEELLFSLKKILIEYQKLNITNPMNQTRLEREGDKTLKFCEKWKRTSNVNLK